MKTFLLGLRVFIPLSMFLSKILDFGRSNSTVGFVLALWEIVPYYTNVYSDLNAIRHFKMTVCLFEVINCFSVTSLVLPIDSVLSIHASTIPCILRRIKYCASINCIVD